MRNNPAVIQAVFGVHDRVIGGVLNRFLWMRAGRRMVRSRKVSGQVSEGDFSSAGQR